MSESFPNEIQKRLQHYVYRLIDPRNGETFYVGKGAGNRLFQHASGEIGPKEADKSAKIGRIHQIQLSGMKVQHVIHRHGLSEKVAFEVEGALIDAYPGLTNVAGGHGNSERGAMHAEELIREFAAEPISFEEGLLKVVEITINRSASKEDIYRATRFAWKLNPQRAEKADFVFAVVAGVVLEVFVPTKWARVDRTNFPELSESEEELDRYGFRGNVVASKDQQRFVGKKMPKRKRGEANPIRYFNC